METATEDALVAEKSAIRKTIHDSIGLALTKNFDLLFNAVAHDANFFIFHPDSASTIVGFDAFKSFAEQNWTNPAFKATRYEIKEQMHFSFPTDRKA